MLPMCNHWFPRSWDTNEFLPCVNCGMEPDDFDPEEEAYWESLLAWVDKQAG